MNKNNDTYIIKELSLSLLSEGSTIKITASGYSMYPVIKPGSDIYIEPLNQKGEPVPGEIIAIQRDKGLVIHRLVRKSVTDSTKIFIARGDSNMYNDSPVNVDKIVGRVLLSENTDNMQSKKEGVNIKPKYYINRTRVIGIVIWKSIRKILG